MSTENKTFTQHKIANKVIRRDYAKFNPNFEEPNLLEIQKNSYEYFLNHELENLIKSYFPIKHLKNNIYEVRYNGMKIVESKRNEANARLEEKTYEKSLYVDLELVNNETGEVKTAKKTKNNLSSGIFFANIPMMTDNGIFIINGTEKFVISQIVRSPGAYILTKSQIKLNNKKKIQEGYVSELLPAKGSMMNFWIDDKNEYNTTLNITARNISGDSAPVFSATQLLKAFGMNQDEIIKLFEHNEFIINTLSAETYNRDTILENEQIIDIKKDIVKNGSAGIMVGSPIDIKLKKLVQEIINAQNKLEGLNEKYNDFYKNYDGKSQITNEIKSISEQKKTLEREVNQLKDKIITEKTAKELIEKFSISTKVIEFASESEENTYCYQDILVRHFTERRQYDLTPAGRYKLDTKLKISERLYNRVLADDLTDVDGNVVFKKQQLIQKNELDEIKRKLKDGKIDLTRKIDLVSHTRFHDDSKLLIEKINIYLDNESCDTVVPLIGLAEGNDSLSLTLPDILSLVSYVSNLPKNIGSYDDIDHLSNKRLRLIHEQFKNKLVAGMARVEKHIKEKLASLSTATMNEEQKQEKAIKTTIKSVVNTKPFQQVVKTFFNSYQLTQFIDQQNPLSELTNKRRISAMGDGGISREDPNLDIRDVHYSHYGRICPIETPEGMNIGLIMSLAAFTKVDEKGFLVTPYRKVVNGIIQDEIVWLTAGTEDEYVITESIVNHDENFRLSDNQVIARYRSSFEMFDIEDVDYIDISPRQVVSIAAGLIPFLENDDTTRALMGANMQRQATPLVKTCAPIVGTGSEYKVAHDSGLAIVAKNDGLVTKVDGARIEVKTANGTDKYNLVKYRKSNQNTCNNQNPIVEIGQKISKDQVLADGPAMHNGELALGRNPLVAFTTWNGYNFEDAIIISERLVQDDIYTSVHIDEHTVTCLRTKNGDEEISRFLPNVGDEAKKHLDQDGIIMVGADVKEGDILVGKISPKGEVTYSPEEKLMNAIFGNKIKSVRDSSLRVPHGAEGTVAAIKRFSIKNNDKLDDDVIELIKIYIVQKRKIQIGDKMAGRHGNKGIVSKVVPKEDMPFLEDGTPIDIMLNPLGVPSRMNLGQIMEIHMGYAMFQLAKKQLCEIIFEGKDQEELSQLFGLSLANAKSLSNAANKYFKEMNLQASNKIADIHLTIILSKAGLTFEDLNMKIATPVFHGANINDISSAFSEAGIDSIKTKGKFKLIDGRTGEYFDSEITVGIMYMLKLDHMVDDKIHARAVGPYSKITQQPLGGRSQNGGQRFGEMEVWALEAYGAAYNLSEILTIKSDDVKGRNLAYSAIIKGGQLPKPNIPESFKLLTKQLQGLSLTINVLDEDDNKIDINTFSSVMKDDEFNQYSDMEKQTTENSAVVEVNTNGENMNGLF